MTMVTERFGYERKNCDYYSFVIVVVVVVILELRSRLTISASIDDVAQAAQSMSTTMYFILYHFLNSTTYWIKSINDSKRQSCNEQSHKRFVVQRTLHPWQLLTTINFR